MSRWLRLAACVALLALCLGGIVYCCYPLLAGMAGGKAAAERSGRRDLSFVAEFDRLYPGGEHFISYYTGTKGPPTWNSKVGLHGRYVLTVQCAITLDVTRTRVVGSESPTFHLDEVTRVQLGPGGSIAYGEQRTFGPTEWRRVVAAGGDLSVLGVSLRKDAPVPGFEAVWVGA